MSDLKSGIDFVDLKKHLDKKAFDEIKSYVDLRINFYS